MRTALAALILALTTIGGQQQSLPSIQGRVVRGSTGQPIAGVRVTGENTGTRLQATATTNATGSFVLAALPMGTYRLTFVARGYVDQVYGSKGDTGRWTPIEIGTGQPLKDLVVQLTPTGSVEGRARDSYGSPAVGAPIALLRASYDADGKKVLSSVVTVSADDIGAYRFFWVTPGRYYLRAGGRVPVSLQMSGRTPDGRNEILDPFAEVFYPGMQTSELATPVEVLAGADLQGMNFRLQSQRLLRIRGRVIDTQTGRIPPDADIGIIGDSFSASGGNLYSKTDGTFEVSGLWPGMFQVVAVLRDLRPLSGQTNGERGPMPTSDFTQIRLVDRDVDDVVLRLLPPVTLSGRIFFEGNSIPTQGMRIQLQSIDGRARGPLSNTFTALVGADGSFEVPQVLQGNYQIGVSDSGFYVKEARYGGSDVLNEPLKFSGVASTPLEIRINRNLAQLSGTITDKQQPVPGIRVVLVPDRGRHRRSLFRETITDVFGRYSFSNVSPGDYRVFAWESIEARAWFDPEVLKKFERYSRQVRLRESSSETANTILIPAEAL